MKLYRVNYIGIYLSELSAEIRSNYEYYYGYSEKEQAYYPQSVSTRAIDKRDQKTVENRIIELQKEAAVCGQDLYNHLIDKLDEEYKDSPHGNWRDFVSTDGCDCSVEEIETID